MATHGAGALPSRGRGLIFAVEAWSWRPRRLHAYGYEEDRRRSGKNPKTEVEGGCVRPNARSGSAGERRLEREYEIQCQVRPTVLDKKG